MCLAVPGKVVRLDGDGHALVDLGGVRQRISVELIDAPREGDWLVCHVGFALSRLDAAEAERTLAMAAAARGGVS